MQCDVCIVGAGAAGLMAAVFAGRAGADVIVLERNTTAGRKLLRTGRGRCNVTHAGDAREMVEACDRFGRFLRHAFYTFSPRDMIAFLAAGGVECRVEPDALVFPSTDRATDIKNVLLAEAKKGPVRIVYGRRVTTIRKAADGFTVDADSGESVRSNAVVVSTGGKSWPQLGSTGDGYWLAEALGHTIIAPKAAVVGLVCRETWTRALQGVAVGDVRMSCIVEGRNIAVRGPMIFTDKGIGGPAAFDLSRFVTDALAAGAGPVDVLVDCMPLHDAQTVQRSLIDAAAEHARKEPVTILSQYLPRALASHVCELAGVDAETSMGQLTKDNRCALVTMLKALPLTVESTCPLEEATVTRGGVCRDEIDPTTMQSKIVPGLFFAGEVIDVDGPCGGYNLQIAWSTGALAGQSAAKA